MTDVLHSNGSVLPFGFREEAKLGIHAVNPCGYIALGHRGSHRPHGTVLVRVSVEGTAESGSQADGVLGVQTVTKAEVSARK